MLRSTINVNGPCKKSAKHEEKPISEFLTISATFKAVKGIN